MFVTLYKSLEKQRKQLDEMNVNVNIEMSSVGSSDGSSDSSNNYDSEIERTLRSYQKPWFCCCIQWTLNIFL